MENVLARLFDHNHWANQQILKACAGLTDEQLDAEPQTATRGSIRATLQHLVTSQRGLLALLTLPPESRLRTPLEFSELAESERLSGEGLAALVALAKSDPDKFLSAQLKTSDGYTVEPWVVMLQVINHAAEHREQIKSMLSALGLTPPDIDGWDYGEATGALAPVTD